MKVKVPAGTQSATVFRLKGKGAPDVRGYGQGDHLVRVVIETPRKLTAKQRELLEEFERDYLVRCLEAAEMNVSLASRFSGLSRKHIRTLMAKYGIAVRRELALGTSLDQAAIASAT